MLEVLAEAEIAGAIERAHNVMQFGNDISEMVKARARAREKNDVMRIVLAVEKRADNPLARSVIVGNAKTQLGIERRGSYHIRHQHLKMIEPKRARAFVLMRARLHAGQRLHACAEFERRPGCVRDM